MREGEKESGKRIQVRWFSGKIYVSSSCTLRIILSSESTPAAAAAAAAASLLFAE